MKITVRQLKRLIREAVGKTNLGDRVRKLDQRSAAINNISIRNNDKETIKNKLIAELEEAYKYSDITSEDEMHDILFAEPDFILDQFVDSDIAGEIIDTSSEDEIAEIVSDWQQEKIDMLLEDFDELPRPLRKMLQGFM